MKRSITAAARGLAPLAAALSLLTVAACAPFMPTAEQKAAPPPAETEVAPPAQQQVAAVPPRPVRKPPVPQAPGTVPAALPTIPPAALPQPPASFDRLNGLDPASTVEWLGEPRQRAESPPATIWRYITRDCELDVYFYLDLRTNQLRALHYELRSQNHDAADRPQQRCYEQLVAERGASAEPTVGADRPR